ncbi:MAG: 1-(5-phosphoribosyl)-5-amino-4-imidazole-carboxylate carboxylase, partial [Planctomycetia bacterium]|nr:1-(5-phosphoribosyl)-5-amino-4-imidazole-carboxylate carboxylase [Planctomycetia bacterium]
MSHTSSSRGEDASTDDLGATRLDLDRERRCGFPEVVYAAGKTVPQMSAIFAAQQRRGIRVLATRMSEEDAVLLLKEFPTGVYNAVARTFRIPAPHEKENVSDPGSSVRRGRVAIVSAGTSDLPVAEEALETALWTGAEAILIQDV